jgi:hypothetical protein
MLDKDFISHGSTPSVAKVAVSSFSVAAAIEAVADSSSLGASCCFGAVSGAVFSFLALILETVESVMGAGLNSYASKYSASAESLLRF